MIILFFNFLFLATDKYISPTISKITLFFLIFFFFWPLHVACGIPWPGIEPGPPAVEAWSPNHWTAKESPQ